MNTQELNDVVDQARQKWERLECPDTFRIRVHSSLGRTLVHIYHHETFPAGGRSFTADVTHPKSGQHLGRKRIHI